MSRQPAVAPRRPHGDRTSAGSKALAPVVASPVPAEEPAVLRLAPALGPQRALVALAVARAWARRRPGPVPASRANEACRGPFSLPGGVDGAKVVPSGPVAEAPRFQRRGASPAPGPGRVPELRPALRP